MPRPREAPLRDKQYYQEEFVEKQRSLQDLATENNTYVNRIRREILSYGYQMRTRSEAQKIALNSGRRKHPTEGRERSESEKIAIANGMHAAWKNVSNGEKARRKQKSIEIWQDRQDETVQLFNVNSREALRETTRSGSKLEKFLSEALQERGHMVYLHSEVALPKETLHVDVFLPVEKIAIEVDGLSHFEPIWGDDHLDRVRSSDEKKNQLLLNYGYNIVRIKYTDKFLSEHRKQEILKNVLIIIEEIQNSNEGAKLQRI